MLRRGRPVVVALCAIISPVFGPSARHMQKSNFIPSSGTVLVH